MKILISKAIISLSLCISVCSLFSCSADADHEIQPPRTESLHYRTKTDDLLPSDIQPANPANDFDLAGIIHNELLSNYHKQEVLPSSTPDIATAVEITGAGNPNFALLKHPRYVPITGTKIDALLESSSSIPDAIAKSGLSADGKLQLANFIATITAFVEVKANFNEVYAYAVAFEASVSLNPKLDAHDKEVLLTTASIARHSLHLHKKKPKKNTDPDWDWLTVNLIGGAQGASLGTAEAISYALAGGIAENR